MGYRELVDLYLAAGVAVVMGSMTDIVMESILNCLTGTNKATFPAYFPSLICMLSASLNNPQRRTAPP